MAITLLLRDVGTAKIQAIRPLTNLNSEFAAAAFPWLHFQGKGVFFDIGEEKNIKPAQYEPYLLNLLKEVKKLTVGATKVKNSHSKEKSVTMTETALKLATGHKESHIMEVALHENICESIRRHFWLQENS